MKLIRVLAPLLALSLFAFGAIAVQARTAIDTTVYGTTENVFGPNCPVSGQTSFYTHFNQSGVMGNDCMTTSGTRIGFDNNFSDNVDAFRTVDNNDADSWKMWAESLTFKYCIIVYDGINSTTPIAFIYLPGGFHSYWGNLSSADINKASSYTTLQVGASC